MRPCHPLPLPVPALGASTAGAGSGGCQGGSAPVGHLPLPPQANSDCLLFGGERWGGSLVGVCKATSSALSAVGHFSVAPGLAWLLHTHKVPVWHVEEQQLGPACGRLWQPRWGVSPTHPSLKNTLRAAESSSSSQGFEPSSATTQSGGNAGTEVMLLGNGPLRSWQGYFWTCWSSSKEQEQRQEQCWASPQVSHPLMDCPSPASSCPALAKLLGWKATPLPVCWHAGHRAV